MLARLYRSYVENYRKLRTAVNAVGAECEAWSYETLQRDAQRQVTLERTIEGQPFAFVVECWEKKPNGELVMSIDSYGLPTLAGMKPTYQFVKRPDGSVYYP